MRLPLLALCFFASGLGSLILEVVWTRSLRLVFGSTTLATSSILVAYMLGLGIGGLVGGRLAGRIRRGVRAYAWIEIVIGICALAVPALLARLPELNRSWLHGMEFWEAALWRFAIVLVLLCIPAALMGATLPILVSALVRSNARIGESTSLLYGWNTLGAVAGVFATTFVLFPALGLFGSNLCGAGIDILVGVLVLAFLARDEVAADPQRAGVAPSAASAAASLVSPSISAALLLVSYGLVGFSALAYEVAWTRTLAIVIGSSIYGFAAMLGTFLTGIALGSLLVRRRIEAIRNPVPLFAWGIAALGVLALATTLLMPHLPSIFVAAIQHFGLTAARVTVFQIALCMAAMLPPTLVLGALFPLACRIVSGERSENEAGSAVGWVYFANTIGSATGAFATGFWLIPAFGLRDTLAGLVALDLALAGVLLLAVRRPGRKRVVALAPLAAAALLVALRIPFDHLALTRGYFKAPHIGMDFDLEFLPIEGVPRVELEYYRDGINSTVSIDREVGALLSLRVNGKPDASNHGDMPTQILLGELPLVFGPPAKKVLVIGYASGVTVGSVARHPGVERIDAVEIEPAMVEASRFFDRESGAPLEDPRVRVLLDDGRNYLAGTDERYDLIVSEPSNPWMSGVANLFTQEFFQAAHGALASDGRLMQWVHLYALEPEAFRSILLAMQRVFPHVYGFAYAEGDADLFLLAAKEPLRRDDLPRWEELPASVQSDLARIGAYSSADLWSTLRLLPEDVAALAAEAPGPNTDDNLRIELGSPWALYEETADPNWQSFARNERGIAPLLEALGEPIGPEVLGGLAYSYATRRQAPKLAALLAMEATRKGGSGQATAAAVFLTRQASDAAAYPIEMQIATLGEAIRVASDGSDAAGAEAVEPLLFRAELLLEAGRAEAALADAEAALVVAPADGRAAHLRAQALARLGRLEAALDVIAPLLASEYAQYDPSVWELAVRLNVRAGRSEPAREILETYLYRENSGWDLLARLEVGRGNPEAAAVFARNAENTRRNYAILAHRNARLALWSGDRESAAQLLEAVLAEEPDNEGARRDLESIRGSRQARRS
ncbi:MAG: hypothetical protein FJ144_10605 [Deltaproteobacteria bacterium]|nr:hypothetical protein [Deltaproteobacteria bacterium]